MRDVVVAVTEWLGEGREVALARVMSMDGFGGRKAGEVWAAAPGVSPVGAVAMGAADAVVAQTADRLFADDSLGALTVSVPVGDAEAVAAGLACGGVAHVLVQRASLVPAALWELVSDRVPVVLATSSVSGVSVLVDVEGALTGSLGSAALDASAATSGRAMLTRGRVLTEVLDGQVFVEAFLPQPHLVVLGEAELAKSLVVQGRLLGWTVDVLAEAQTDRALALVGGFGPLDAAVVLSHDVPASSAVLAAALRGGCGYAGALGSRHTQTARAEHLRNVLGVSDALIAEVHGPVGLDLGSRTPAETALAIFAEIIANRSGRSAASLRNGSGPING